MRHLTCEHPNHWLASDLWGGLELCPERIISHAVLSSTGHHNISIHIFIRHLATSHQEVRSFPQPRLNPDGTSALSRWTMQQTCTEELLRRGHKTPYSFPRSHALSHSEDTPSEPSHHDDNQATGETIVLKYGFYYYSSMVQPIDQKTTNCHWKKIIPLIVPRRMGTRHAMGGGGGDHMWKHQGRSGGRRRKGNRQGNRWDRISRFRTS